MFPATGLIQVLTDPVAPINEKRGIAEEFSRDFGWRPNDFLDVPGALPATNLIVEQGLDNAAMLSFLPSNRRLIDVQPDERRDILSISYNSLVDWHVCIDQGSIQYFYNLADPPEATDAYNFDETDYSALTRKAFDEAVGLTPNPNHMSLDGALLDTISTWRRILRLELGSSLSTSSISALFNAIIFARAVEDFDAKAGAANGRVSLREHVRLSRGSISDAIENCISAHVNTRDTSKLFDRSALDVFENLSSSSVIELIDAFYRHEKVPYDYDFSVMSKYALSKIYERYVAVMQNEESIQFSLFPLTPDEAWNKKLGGIYTPQYIATFFARYLRSRVSRDRFIDSKVVDPACGSGIFLRAIMEQKLLASDLPYYEALEPTLDSLLGVDIDANAVAASRLSLALLYLATRGNLPEDVPIYHEDSLARFAATPLTAEETFDAVLANPPFVRRELQSDVVRQVVSEHAGRVARGKLDTYLAFLAFSIRFLRPGGYGCFVIPQPLLTSDNLRSLRNWILEQAYVRVIADLSAIRVFRANVYVALLIVQRKDGSELPPPPVSLIRCQDDVGLALDDFLSGKHRQTSSYFIFDAPQESLTRATWAVATPEEAALIEKLEAMPRLNEVATVTQGVISGADNVFIIDEEEIPSGEESIYRPLMPDRMVGRYALPEETGRRIFYPFFDGVAMDDSRLMRNFPMTWERLNRHRDTLSARKSLAKHELEWWRLSWPRSPQDVLSPKIVAPEVSLLPRFGLDLSGKWIVSHSPFVRPKTRDSGRELLLTLSAILNSSVLAWYIDLNARKFRNGYNKIGVSLLRRLPIPDLSQIHGPTLRRVVGMARVLENSFEGFDHELASSLDDLVLRELYGLSDEDISLVRP